MRIETGLLLTITWAAGFGLFAQVIARRWSIPAIVPLLFLGVLLGPDILGCVHPELLGLGLGVLVKLSVAIVLFEGALNLRPHDLRQSLRDIRSLVTTGVLVTWVGAAVTACWLAGLSWPTAVLFGALVTVTGPTVVQPLLKHVQVPRNVRATLEGEATLVDPIGAMLAVTVLDLLLSAGSAHPTTGLLLGIWGYVSRLVVGAVVGWLMGLGVSRVTRRLLLAWPDLSNIMVLAAVWAAFGIAEAAQGDAGIAAAVAMGLAFRREAAPELRRLRAFKEQLTILGISVIFVLLAASVSVKLLRAEGWPGLLTVTVLMFLVRPAAVVLSLRRSQRSWREKAFIAWVSPRGIVAASTASLSSIALTQAGLPDGERLLALTFLTIAVTVTVQGLTAPLFARLLGIHGMEGRKAIIVGAGGLARRVAEILREGGRPVTLVDRNPHVVDDAQRLGFDSVEGNALDEETLNLAGAAEADTLLAVTPNSEVNVLSAQLAHDLFGVSRAYPALVNPEKGAGPQLVKHLGGSLAFGRAIDVVSWERAVADEQVERVPWVVLEGWPNVEIGRLDFPDEVLPVARLRGKSIEVACSAQIWRKGDEVVFLCRGSREQVFKLLLGLTNV